jgi:hypothetical protein
MAGFGGQVMLIKSVEYSAYVDENGGADVTARLSLTIPDGFSNTVNATDAQRQVNIIGQKWNTGDFQ